MKNKYSKNIWKIAVLTAVTDTFLSAAVFGIFLLSHGLTLVELSTVVSAWLLLYSLGSIPAGLLADRFNYKLSLLLGSAILSIGSLIFATAGSYLFFLIGYASLGLGSAFLGGPAVAMLYDGLLADGEKDNFKRVMSKSLFAVNIFAVIASISGGLIYAYIGPMVPFYIEALFAAIAFILACTLKSPPQEKTNESLLMQLKENFIFALKTKHFSKIFLFSAIIGSVSVTTFQYLQPLYKHIEVPEALFGFLAAGAFLLRGLGSWYADRLGKLFSIDHYLILHAAIFSFFLFLLQSISQPAVIVGIVAVLYFLRGLYMPTVSTYINDQVPSLRRATIISMNSQLLFIFSTVSLMVIGYFGTSQGLLFSFYILGIISLFELIAYICTIRKVTADVE